METINIEPDRAPPVARVLAREARMLARIGDDEDKRIGRALAAALVDPVRVARIVEESEHGQRRTA